MSDNRPNRYYDRSAYSNHERPKPQPKQRGPVKHGGMTIAIPASKRIPLAQRSKRPIDKEQS